MDRRDFLGSVIGMFAASRLPFIAEKAPTITAIDEWERLRVLASIPSHQLRLMQALYYFPDGTIKAAPIKAAERTNTKIAFTLEPWEAKQSLIVQAAEIVTPDGVSIGSKHTFNHGGIYLAPGNTLKTTFTISLYGDEP